MTTGAVADFYEQRQFSIKRLVSNTLQSVLPCRVFWQYLAWRMGEFDVELQMLPHLCDRKKLSIDVGASIGSYTVNLLNHSRNCVSFEPIPDAAALITRRLLQRDSWRLRVENMAISDHSGEMKLRIPVGETGRSTLEEDNHIESLGGTVESIRVPVRRLDDFDDFGTVGCIKIDVEGHEAAALRGAENLLRRDKPSLLVEIEERHKPGSVNTVRTLLHNLGYSGFFYRNGQLYSMDRFDAARDQDVSNIADNINRDNKYINNFLFFHSEALPRVQHLLAHAGSRQR